MSETPDARTSTTPLARVEEPTRSGGLRFGLYLKLILAYAVMILAVYALIPYFILRSEQMELLNALNAAAPISPVLALQRLFDSSRMAVLVASLVNAILMLLGVLLLRLAVRPIKEVSDGMRHLARGEPVRVVTVETGDEISDLADSFNWLSRQLAVYKAELAVREQELERRVEQRTHELSAQQQFSDGVVQTCQVGILTVDTQLRVTTWNATCEKLLGLSQADAIGKPFEEVVPLSQREVLAAELHTVLATGKFTSHTEFESNVTRPGTSSARWMCCDLSFVPLRGEGQKITGALLTLYDVTERKELHMQLSQSTKLAAVGELAGGVAHEINNPLAIILGNAELLTEDLGEQNPLTKQAQTIKRHALRCKEIVANLLKFAGRTQHGSGPIDIRRLSEETLALLRRQLELDNIKIEETYAPGLGLIIGSPDELQQVLFSLLSNARDAMPKGGTLSIDIRQSGGQMGVSIGDTGMGIPKENLDRVFSPFFTTKDPGKGTGLGLAIAHTIAAKHGGRIAISSEVDKGTNVVLWLPLAADQTPMAAIKPISGEPPRASPQRRARMRILVVDDETGIRMVCREALERMNHEVIECQDGLQALARLGDGTYDLVLMDLKMPNLDGAETLSRIRQTDQSTPVLIMTGLIDEDMLANVPPGSFSGILKKPFQISELKSWIAKFSTASVN